MSRSGYNDDVDDNWQHIMWRGRVASATRCARGQAFLRDLIAALDSMPAKRLVADHLVKEGDVCAIGSVGLARGVDMSSLDPEDPDQVAGAFNIAEPLAREIVWANDEGAWGRETPEERWTRMRAWAERRIQDRRITTQ